MNTPAGRLLGALGVLGLGAAALTWLSPGGLGEEETVEVTGGASASGYREVTEAVADVPSWLGHFLEVATDGIPVLLGLLLCWMWWSALRRRDARGTAGAVLAGLGTVAAYAASEALKLVVDEERPCRAALRAGVDTLAECPAAGDWSFPSNHSTLAVGLGVGLALLWPRLAALALPLAAAGALLRVVVGAHYPHDVLAGSVLGGTVVAAVLLVLLPPAQRAVSRLRWMRGDDPGLVDHHRGGSAVVHAEPRQDGSDMGLDHPFHHMQPPGDLPVGQAAAQEGPVRPVPGG